MRKFLIDQLNLDLKTDFILLLSDRKGVILQRNFQYMESHDKT